MARSDPEKLAQALRANLRRRKGPQGPGDPAGPRPAADAGADGAPPLDGAVPDVKTPEKP